MNLHLQRRIIAAFMLSLSLAGVHGGALAQQTDAPLIVGNVDGTCVTAPPAGNPGANAGDWTITCGDLNPGSGMTVIGPPTVASGPVPVEVAPAPVIEPAPVEAPPPDTTVETAETTTAVATETDLDADNYPDALEWEVGLDPNNPDTDGDGVADGDEVNIYGTDPLNWDTDGDGVSDGEELFGIMADPLVWNDVSTDSSTQALEQETAPAPAQSFAQQGEVVTLGQQASEDVTAASDAAAALGTGNASAAPGTVTRDGVSGISLLGPDGTYNVSESDLDGDNYADALEVEIGLDPSNPDTDGDGVADGDEFTVYGTDPFTWDSDGDGLSDGEELFASGTDPLVWDTDGDGISVGEELPA